MFLTSLCYIAWLFFVSLTWRSVIYDYAYITAVHLHRHWIIMNEYPVKLITMLFELRLILLIQLGIQNIVIFIFSTKPIQTGFTIMLSVYKAFERIHFI